MPENNFNEEIKSHAPIHDDAYTWDDFKDILKNGEYEEDKIYFISDVSSSVAFLQNILTEIKKATIELQNLLNN